MQITITARHFELTNAIRDYIEESSRKLIKYFDHIIHVSFVLSFENNRNIVEMNLHIPKNNMISESEDPNMYMAIDLAIERMEQQVKKLKDKWSDHQKQSVKDTTSFVYANLIEKKEKRSTVKIKRIAADVMTVNEAIDAFENTNSSYLIFRNEETDRVNVLVKKDDEHYKLIEP
jgi:putative sigma-54 modulation protein